MHLIHLSDIHLPPLPELSWNELMSKRAFGYISWQRKRRHQHSTKSLETVLQAISHKPADHVVVSGDLTNLSLDGEFIQTATWLKRLGPPDQVSVVPGNHDAYVKQGLRDGWQWWDTYMRDDTLKSVSFPYQRQRGNIVIIGLSTAVPSPVGFAYGELGPEQLKGLEQRLQAVAGEDCLRVVIMHHPPMFCTSRRGLRDAEGFIDVIRRVGCDLILSGHEHSFRMGHIECLDGRQVPVISGLSASLTGKEGKPDGGYLSFDLPESRQGYINLRRYENHGAKGLDLIDSGIVTFEDGKSVLRPMIGNEVIIAPR